jgi:hypothetical protein
MGGFNNFTNLNYLSEHAKVEGTLSPKVAVAGTAVILIVSGLSMLLGVYPEIGKDADPDIPRLKQAKAEYAKLD